VDSGANSRYLGATASAAPAYGAAIFDVVTGFALPASPHRHSLGPGVERRVAVRHGRSTSHGYSYRLGRLLPWMLGAGALSVSLYQKRTPETLITPGMGMKLGALAGLFGFVVNSVVSTVSFLTLRSRGDFRHAMEQQMQKQMAANPDPKVQEMMQRMVEWMTTPQGAATIIVFFLLIMGVVFVLFTAAGGALGASMFRQRREFR
jgi:hypothetical protein